ncbi:hypothetical protein FH972_024946 [Carpinus fangiana]|uniref:proline--tRNA ligase n=1 Tax=Carpinus fangiana TaxID=176857 RepID=A0A5N6KZL3_9ROSI|nr:hypothetical protein FH972_024946 [Carpinus fangiana]
MADKSTDLADRTQVADKEVDVTQVAANEQAKAPKKPKKEPKEKKVKPPQGQGSGKKEGGGGGGKKGGKPAEVDTKAITATKEDDLAAWYQEILLKGDFLEYSDIPGCYIINPSSYAVWENIVAFLNSRFKKMGVRNCYFPLFISEANLQKEKDHLEGFEAEVAWVTHGGKDKLQTRLAVRPTSETAMYPYYAKKIRSHRDLPLRLNQWNNVVRWEFKHAMPFLRSREFLWQEGHTAHLTKEAAGEEVLQILDHYAAVYEELLAVPVVKGTKTDNEKFAGADYTTTIEGYIPATGRGIQAGTSHCLGQHFSKMFSITVEDPSAKDGEKKPPLHVWQNSWGFTTRSIGVAVLIHSDNKGLVIPPRVSEVQVVVVPVGITAKLSQEVKDKMVKETEAIRFTLEQAGVRVESDLRDNYSPGFKFNEWELKGVPLRVEFGPKDSEQHVITVSRRDQDGKSTIPITNISEEVPKLLETIQQDMFNRASEAYAEHRVNVTDWDQFVPSLNAKNVNIIPHCLGGPCEDEIKDLSKRVSQGDDLAEDARAPSMGAKSLCIPFEQPEGLVEGETKCLNPNCKNLAKKWVMFGRSY